jgi:hypothetical protein
LAQKSAIFHRKSIFLPSTGASPLRKRRVLHKRDEKRICKVKKKGKKDVKPLRRSIFCTKEGFLSSDMSSWVPNPQFFSSAKHLPVQDYTYQHRQGKREYKKSFLIRIIPFANNKRMIAILMGTILRPKLTKVIKYV